MTYNASLAALPLLFFTVVLLVALVMIFIYAINTIAQKDNVNVRLNATHSNLCRCCHQSKINSVIAASIETNRVE